MTKGSPNFGVQLPDSGHLYPSAGAFLHWVVRAVVQQFPGDFDDHLLARRPPAFFTRRRLAHILEEFEPQRSTSTNSVAIARFATDLIQKSVEVGYADRRLPLEAAFREPAEPLSVVQDDRSTVGKAGMAQGRLPDEDLHLQIEESERTSRVTVEGVKALEWALKTIEQDALDLTGEKVVLLGGTAELSPLALLLSLGADVLTTHTSLASVHDRLVSELDDPQRYAGRLFYAAEGVDLLQAPVEFSRSIIDFAGGRSVHVGALAYKGGQAREWRLAAVMDGIARTVRDAGILGSIFYYLSPSMMTEVSSDTASLAHRQLVGERTLTTQFVRLLTRNTLFKPNIVPHAKRYWPRSLLPDQGASYMGANLFGKIYPAEVYSKDTTAGGTRRVRVSANVAPITRTASTETRDTTFLFPELERLGVKVFDPGSTRRLMGWLMLHDLFGPNRAPSDGLFRQQVHGGVFTNPWALNSLMKLAYGRAQLKRLL